jgi:ribosome-binding protein aMBF1 (putative translation factor)
MAYNTENALCYHKDCKDEFGERTHVWKGDGLRVWVDGRFVTLCRPCAIARNANKKKAATKRAYVKRQPTLFDD